MPNFEKDQPSNYPLADGSEKRHDYPDDEKLQILRGAVGIHLGNLAEFEDSELWELSKQVSDAVQNYNSENPAEMLNKDPETIINQLSSGNSVIIAGKDSKQQPIFLYHGAMYPMFEEGEQDSLGYQIIEFGTAITNVDFRNMGLGQQGLTMRLSKAKEYSEKGRLKVFSLSTIKRLVTGYVFGKHDFTTISYWDHPYLSFLTDTCTGSSERFGHKSCEFRRSVNDSDVSFDQLIKGFGKNAYIPCTLVVSDPKMSREFDDHMRFLHASLGGRVATRGDISVESYERIGEFYEQFKK